MAELAPSPDFAGFVAYRSASLLRSAWFLTGDAGRAEDLLQTALAKAWRHWSTVARADDPEAYVRRIIFTTYVTWWRRRWRSEVPSEVVPDRAGPHDLAGAVATRDAVRRALARLSRQQRAVVVLRYAEDRSVAETAALLGCSVGTVRVQSSRALAILRNDPSLRHHTWEGVNS
jgi:RNA polymerase sigma-70 factor (sigma-E family)